MDIGRTLRISLIYLEVVIGLGAFIGGSSLIIGTLQLDTTLLRGTPFNSYVIPGIVLVTVVGGSMLAAAITEIAHKKIADLLSEYAGMVLVGWILLEELLIGHQSLLQPLLFLLGIVTILLALEQQWVDARR